MPKERTCLTCRHWDPPSSPTNASPDFGICRTAPPQINIMGGCNWPGTKPDQWCGYQMPVDGAPIRSPSEMAEALRKGEIGRGE